MISRSYWSYWFNLNIWNNSSCPKKLIFLQLCIQLMIFKFVPHGFSWIFKYPVVKKMENLNESGNVHYLICFESQFNMNCSLLSWWMNFSWNFGIISGVFFFFKTCGMILRKNVPSLKISLISVIKLAINYALF